MQGGKRRRRSKADPYLAQPIEHVWTGSSFRPPTDSDSTHSSSATSASADDEPVQGDSTDAESDLDDFIVNDARESERDLAGTGQDEDEFDGQDTSGRVKAAFPQSILQKAGFNISQSDGDYFRTYIEYLVYDLVDKTFAVRLGQDRSLYQYYNAAIKRIEERMADRRYALQSVLRVLSL